MRDLRTNWTGQGEAKGRLPAPGEVVLLHGQRVRHQALQRLLGAGVAGVPPEVVGRVIFLLSRRETEDAEEENVMGSQG